MQKRPLGNQKTQSVLYKNKRCTKDIEWRRNAPWEIKCCKICTAEGGEPKELKEELIVSAALIGGIILFVVALVMAASYKQGAITNPTFMLVVTCASLFLFALLWFAPRIGDIFCYLKWKKWAKKRGWE